MPSSKKVKPITIAVAILAGSLLMLVVAAKSYGQEADLSPFDSASRPSIRWAPQPSYRPMEYHSWVERTYDYNLIHSSRVKPYRRHPARRLRHASSYPLWKDRSIRRYGKPVSNMTIGELRRHGIQK